MNNEKQKTILKQIKTQNKNSALDETILNNNLISYFIINDKQGTIILARQFQELTKSELFYHAAFFHQLIKNSKNEMSETKSFFDNKELRYIYFPLENENENEKLFSVLLIKKDYNIFAALSIIKLIQRMIFEINKQNKKKETNEPFDYNKGKVRLNFLFPFLSI